MKSLLLAGAILALVGGCGGGDSVRAPKNPTPPPPPDALQSTAGDQVLSAPLEPAGRR